MPSEAWEAPAWSTKTSSGSKRSRTWVRTPNIKQLKDWDKPINLYTDFPFKATCSFWGGAQYYDSATGITTIDLSPQYPFTLNEVASDNGNFTVGRENALGFASYWAGVDNSNVIKLLGKVSEAKVNVGVMYAEMTKTSDLILNTANRIDRAYRAFRRGNLKEVARALQLTPGTVHKNWLEYKYGWMPLLMDVKGSAEFFAQQAVTRPIRFTEMVKHEKEFCNETHNLSFIPYGGSPAAVETRTVKITYRARHKIWCEITNESASQMQQLGLTNPALIAWELIPYSFVFDWFVSVGDYLQAFTALDGIIVKKAFVEHLTKYEVSHSRPHITRVQGTKTYVVFPWSTTWGGHNYGRAPLSINVYDLYPPVKPVSYSFDRLITALALLKGGYRGPARI